MHKTYTLGAILFSLTLVTAGCGMTTTAPEANNTIMQEKEAIQDIQGEKIEEGQLAINTQESSMTWYGEKITGSSHTGTVDIMSGNIVYDENKLVSGSFTIDMTTITDSDGNERLETHLKSDDFFDVEQYPTATLDITDVAQNEDDTYKITADLTIKGITNKVNFDAQIDASDTTITGTAQFDIDRTLWDIRYGSGKFFQGLGDNLIKDMMDFDITIVAQK